MAFKIGDSVFSDGIFLAPMAGITDKSYRRVCAACGAELTYTEMVSAKALCYNDKSSFELSDLSGSDKSTAIQLFGHEPDIIYRAICILLDRLHKEGKVPKLIDINMGCPVKKIVSNCEGSALMKDPILAGKIVEEAVKASTVPITVKIRAGWDGNSINAPEFAKAMQDSGALAVTVHGRTREQMYSPPVMLDVIRRVKQSVSIPVIGNGGIFTFEDAEKMLDGTGCDGIMLARGTMGNPWLFEEIACRLKGMNYTEKTISERIKTALSQIRDMIEDKGERIGTMEARRHLAYYIKGIRGSAELRYKINTANSYSEMEELVRGIVE